jgi:hypothetical protein
MDLQEGLVTFDSSNPNFNRWAFRGQPSTFGTLVPSFQRVFLEKRSVPAAMLIESRLIEAFRIHYQNLTEKTASMPPSAAIDQGRDLKCLSVMQHYGVPTRLLDWTTDFWTAVYFACAGHPSEDAELWYYDRNSFDEQGKWINGLDVIRNSPDPFYVEPILLTLRNQRIIFEFDPKITPRMRQQYGHHTVSTDVFADHAPLLMDLVGNKSNGSGGFHRIIIAKGCKEKTLKFLDENLGINASYIFPDVEGLGRFLRWQLDSLLTTLL